MKALTSSCRAEAFCDGRKRSCNQHEEEEDL
jgi:hypothetical protein